MLFMLARHQLPISSRGKSRPPYLSLRLVARSPQGGRRPNYPHTTSTKKGGRVGVD